MTDAPTWRVVAVFDPDGEGADFAYTVGLAARGLPELHLWARPNDGHDPGADWAFSPTERAQLLNNFARDALAGRLVPGSQVVEKFDAGAATVTFTFHEPVSPGDVDAFQVDDGATVIPIRWTLERVPEGPLTGFGEAAQTRARNTHRDLTVSLEPARVADLPSRWRPAEPTDVSFAPQQQYGPATPVIVARGAQVATADADTLADFLHLALLADQSTSPRHVLALTSAVARPVGRTRAVEATRAAATDLVDVITGSQSPTQVWRDVLDELTEPGMRPDERDRFAQSAAELLRHAVAALLSTDAVGDVADQQLWTAGYGPWLTALSGSPFESPAPQWNASDACLADVRALLSDLTAADLHRLADAHHAALLEDPRVAPDPGFPGIFWWLRAQAVTSPAGIPSLADLLAGTAGGTALQALARDPDTADNVRAVAATVTAALTAASGLREADRDLLVRPYTPFLPALRTMLDKYASVPQ